MSFSRPILALLAVLILSSLSCRTVTQGWQVRPPSPSAPAAVQLSNPTSLPTTAPTTTDLPPSQTPYVAPASETPVVVFTAGPDLPADPLQLQIFEELWQVVRDDYLYPDFNGLDWDAVHDQYLKEVEAGLAPDDFYLLMDEMIALLGDEHSIYFSPKEAAELDAEYAGEHDYVGIGILNVTIQERGLTTILLVFPGSPADEAGLRPHDNILAVDGEAIVDENGLRRDLLRGPEGTSIELTVQTPGEAPRQVSVTRRRILGATPVPYEVLVTSNGRRIGYLMLVTFNDSTVDDQVGEALAAMSADGPLDGVIVDNRNNGGGASSVLVDTLSYFTGGEVGYFVERDEKHALQIEAQDVGGSQDIPLVVLVGAGTASFGEIFSGILQDTGRAYILGQQTEGNVEILYVYDFSDGSRAWIARETFQPLNQPDENWEQTGISPDLTVHSNWDQVTLSTDPVIQAALEYLNNLE